MEKKILKSNSNKNINLTELFVTEKENIVTIPYQNTSLDNLINHIKVKIKENPGNEDDKYQTYKYSSSYSSSNDESYYWWFNIKFINIDYTKNNEDTKNADDKFVYLDSNNFISKIIDLDFNSKYYIIITFHYKNRELSSIFCSDFEIERDKYDDNTNPLNFKFEIVDNDINGVEYDETNKIYTILNTADYVELLKNIILVNNDNIPFGSKDNNGRHYYTLNLIDGKNSFEIDNNHHTFKEVIELQNSQEPKLEYKKLYKINIKIYEDRKNRDYSELAVPYRLYIVDDLYNEILDNLNQEPRNFQNFSFKSDHILKYNNNILYKIPGNTFSKLKGYSLTNAQYSSDNENWHDEYQTGDLWIKIDGIGYSLKGAQYSSDNENWHKKYINGDTYITIIDSSDLGIIYSNNLYYITTIGGFKSGVQYDVNNLIPYENIINDLQIQFNYNNGVTDCTVTKSIQYGGDNYQVIISRNDEQYTFEDDFIAYIYAGQDFDFNNTKYNIIVKYKNSILGKSLINNIVTIESENLIKIASEYLSLNYPINLSNSIKTYTNKVLAKNNKSYPIEIYLTQTNKWFHILFNVIHCDPQQINDYLSDFIGDEKENREIAFNKMLKTLCGYCLSDPTDPNSDVTIQKLFNDALLFDGFKKIHLSEPGTTGYYYKFLNFDYKKVINNNGLTGNICYGDFEFNTQIGFVFQIIKTVTEFKIQSQYPELTLYYNYGTFNTTKQEEFLNNYGYYYLNNKQIISCKNDITSYNNFKFENNVEINNIYKLNCSGINNLENTYLNQYFERNVQINDKLYTIGSYIGSYFEWQNGSQIYQQSNTYGSFLDLEFKEIIQQGDELIYGSTYYGYGDSTYAYYGNDNTYTLLTLEQVTLNQLTPEEEGTPKIYRIYHKFNLNYDKKVENFNNINNYYYDGTDKDEIHDGFPIHHYYISSGNILIVENTDKTKTNSLSEFKFEKETTTVSSLENINIPKLIWKPETVDVNNNVVYSYNNINPTEDWHEEYQTDDSWIKIDDNVYSLEGAQYSSDENGEWHAGYQAGDRYIKIDNISYSLNNVKYGNPGIIKSIENNQIQFFNQSGWAILKAKFKGNSIYKSSSTSCIIIYNKLNDDPQNTSSYILRFEDNSSLITYHDKITEISIYTINDLNNIKYNVNLNLYRKAKEKDFLSAYFYQTDNLQIHLLNSRYNNIENDYQWRCSYIYNNQTYQHSQIYIDNAYYVRVPALQISYDRYIYTETSNEFCQTNIIPGNILINQDDIWHAGYKEGDKYVKINNNIYSLEDALYSTDENGAWHDEYQTGDSLIKIPIYNISVENNKPKYLNEDQIQLNITYLYEGNIYFAYNEADSSYQYYGDPDNNIFPIDSTIYAQNNDTNLNVINIPSYRITQRNTLSWKGMLESANGSNVITFLRKEYQNFFIQNNNGIEDDDGKQTTIEFTLTKASILTDSLDATRPRLLLNDQSLDKFYLDLTRYFGDFYFNNEQYIPDSDNWAYKKGIITNDTAIYDILIQDLKEVNWNSTTPPYSYLQSPRSLLIQNWWDDDYMTFIETLANTNYINSNRRFRLYISFEINGIKIENQITPYVLCINKETHNSSYDLINDDSGIHWWNDNGTGTHDKETAQNFQIA